MENEKAKRKKYNILLKVVEKGDINTFKSLMKVDEFRNLVDERLFITAVDNNKINLIKEMLDKNYIDPSFNNNFIIKRVSGDLINGRFRGNLELVKFFLKDPRVDPSGIPIINAASIGGLSIVNELLKDPRVDPSFNRNYAIILASENGNLDVVNRLLEDPRVDPSDQNNEAIRLSSDRGNLDVVNRLLEDPRIDWNDETLPNEIKQIIKGKREMNSKKMINYIWSSKELLPEGFNREIYSYIKRFGKKSSKRKSKKKIKKNRSKKIN